MVMSLPRCLDGAPYLCHGVADTACAGQCQRCCGGSRKHSRQRPPSCCGCTVCRNGSRTSQNPRERELGEGMPGSSAFCSWLPSFSYSITSSRDSPYWGPRSNGSSRGQANWREESTIKIMEKYLKDEYLVLYRVKSKGHLRSFLDKTELELGPKFKRQLPQLSQ